MDDTRALPIEHSAMFGSPAEHRTSIGSPSHGQSVTIRGRLNSYLRQDNRVVDHLRKHFADITILFMGCTVRLIESRKFVPLVKKGENTKKILDMLEIALISHLTAQGYELINLANTKNLNEITFKKNQFCDQWSPEKLEIPESRLL
jgi:hypothetical protein